MSEVEQEVPVELQVPPEVRAAPKSAVKTNPPPKPPPSTAEPVHVLNKKHFALREKDDSDCEAIATDIAELLAGVGRIQRKKILASVERQIRFLPREVAKPESSSD